MSQESNKGASGAGEFSPGDRALVIDSRSRRYMITLKPGAEFHFHRGFIAHDLILSGPPGRRLVCASGEKISVMRPAYSDFVLKMPRGAQVVYPKDAAMVIMAGDIHPGASVLEAGVGSGALTIALLRAVGPQGRIYGYDRREDFVKTALANIEAFYGPAPNLEITVGDVGDAVPGGRVDRVVLDLPEPWQVLERIGQVLEPGGAGCFYLPTILQVSALCDALAADDLWVAVHTQEVLARSWHVEGRSVRPEHRMTGHTGFITTARRLVAG